MPATTRKQVAANLDDDEHRKALALAKKARMTVGNYIRVKAFGFAPLKHGRPKKDSLSGNTP